MEAGGAVHAVDDVGEYIGEGQQKGARQGTHDGVDCDESDNAERHPVLVEQMPNAHGQVQLEEARGKGDHHHQAELQDADDAVGGLDVPVGKDVLQPPEQVPDHLPVPGKDDQDGQHRHHDAEEGRHDGADQLGADELPGTHGQGVHQISLVTQQALEKPLDGKEL